MWSVFLLIYCFFIVMVKTKNQGTKKRKYIKKSNLNQSSQSNLSDILIQINKEYEELKQKHEKTFQKLKEKLVQIRILIRKNSFPNLYHKRNLFIRHYDQLNQSKIDIENNIWEKSFLIKYDFVLQRLHELEESKKQNKNVLSNHINNVAVSKTKESYINHKEENKSIIVSETQIISPHKQLDICSNPKCILQPLVQIPKEGKIVCISCGMFNRDLSSSTNHLAYGEEVEAPAQHQYERSKNFKAFLHQFSEDAKHIPDELIADLTLHLRANPNRSQQELRCTPCKTWLKSHSKWKKYADCAFRICNMVNGVHIPRFTKTEITEYINDFEIVEMLFFQIKNSPRNNFLNAFFVMNKLTEIHGQKHHQSAFPLLRHKRTLLEQESLWQLICEKTKWPYYRSI